MNHDDYKEFACASLLERVEDIRLKIESLFVQVGNCDVLVDFCIEASSMQTTLEPIEMALKATQEAIGDVISELAEESLRRKREGRERT